MARIPRLLVARIDGAILQTQILFLCIFIYVHFPPAHSCHILLPLFQHLITRFPAKVTIGSLSGTNGT